jgi:hypothetical protein
MIGSHTTWAFPAHQCRARVWPSTPECRVSRVCVGAHVARRGCCFAPRRAVHSLLVFDFHPLSRRG